MRARSLAAAVAAVLAVAGCTTSTVAGSGTPVLPPAPTSSAAVQPRHQYYLSLGDSYPAGYQPGAGTTRVGFPYQVRTDAKAKDYDYTLVNLACSGATTASVLHSPGCAASLRAPGSPAYSASQADAAVTFLEQHPGQVGLITISIGGNDFLGCAGQLSTSCLTNAVRTIGSNLGALLTRLRAAAGSATRIVGSTYPDFFLGELLSGDAVAHALARLSVPAFETLLNPELARTYAAANATFVDVTRASGGYGSLDRRTNLPPYGRIPVPVADICKLTWFCSRHDVHPTPAGHALIAKLIVATLPRR